MDKQTSEKLDDIFNKLGSELIMLNRGECDEADAVIFMEDELQELRAARSAIDALYQQKFARAVEEAKPVLDEDPNEYPNGNPLGIAIRQYQANLTHAWTGDEMPHTKRETIRQAVKRGVKEYGETLHKLADE